MKARLLSLILAVVTLTVFAACGQRGFELSKYEAKQEALQSLENDPYIKIIREDEIDAESDVVTYGSEGKVIDEDTEEDQQEDDTNQGISNPPVEHNTLTTPIKLPTYIDVKTPPSTTTPKVPSADAVLTAVPRETAPEPSVPLRRPVILDPDSNKLPEFMANRPKHQAQYKPTRGTLRNATNFLELSQGSNTPFRMFNFSIKNNTYYGTYDLAQVISYIGLKIRKFDPTFIMSVGSVSKRSGGYLRPHSSHQTGIDADVAFAVSDSKKEFKSVVVGKAGIRGAFQADKQWEIFSEAFRSGTVAIIFADYRVKYAVCKYAQGLKKSLAARGETLTQDEINSVLSRIKHERGHDDHFHMRIKCNKATQEKCDQPAKYNAQPTDCGKILSSVGVRL